MRVINQPGITIAGLSGDSGKTLLSCGIINALRKRGYSTAAFKKGPDYIDAAWLSLASGRQARNLDSYLMTKEVIRDSYAKNSLNADISVIEGNRGLHDGVDTDGSHSTAVISKITGTPVLLAVNVTKMTRTVAALALGCKLLDKEVDIAGIIINKVAGTRQENLIRKAIMNEAGIEVLGAIPKLNEAELLPSRHLGLVTPSEHEQALASIDMAGNYIAKYTDLDLILAKAFRARPIELKETFKAEINGTYRDDNTGQEKVKIGYFRDKVFTFYYPENLEALEDRGAELIPVSPMEAWELPDLDGLYIGGGFPETHAGLLSGNRQMMRSVRKASLNGLPIYAECGGLMYLAGKLIIEGLEYQMAGVFDIECEMNKKPEGHGYVKARIIRANPFYPAGTKIKGHEFHYSKIISYNDMDCCLELEKGTGALDNKDGLIKDNTFASYTHLHALSSDEWAGGFMKKAKEYKYSAISKSVI